MREFTSTENAFIERIVQIHRENGLNSLPELQVSRLLRNELKFFALSWEIKPKPTVTIYVPKREKDSTKINDLFFQVADFIYFIEELELLGFIKLQNIPSDKKEDFTILYDRDEYEYSAEDKRFWQNIKDVIIGGDKYSGKALVALEGWHSLHNDFAYDLDKCGLSIIYPLPLAASYVDNGFKTDEQLNLESQLSDTKASLKWAKRTFWITVGALIATLAIAKCGHQTIDENQLNNLIDSIGAKIDRNHLSEPILISTSDTIKVSPINTISKTAK